RAAASHTGSIAGMDAAYDAAFKQTRVLRFSRIDEMFDAARAFATQPLPEDGGAAIVTNAGGTGVLLADACELNRVPLARFSTSTIKELEKILPPHASFRNPLDVIGDTDAERYTTALKIVLRDPSVNAVIANMLPTALLDVEEAAEACTRAKALLIEAESWRVVPAENIIAAAAGKCEVYAEARDLRDALSLLSALEKGVDAVVLTAKSAEELRETLRQLKSYAEGFLKLEEAEVVRVQEAGLGDRACVDTALLLSQGEGMLVGSKASLLFLVHSETLENPFIEPRPFRVNAGAVHSYILSSLRGTSYLSELRSGSSVLAVSWRGRARRAVVGRVKIEKRPMLLVEAEASGEAGTVLLQDAETVCLVSPGGEAVSVRELEEGSKVLVHKPGAKARHAGMAVDEFVLEK
ncbi:MAG: hypothetical protein DRN96_02735, partial [Thermoproteota archaeon]